MNRKNLILSLSLLFLVATTSPVAALEIIMDSTGRATFYNDGVLGDSVDEDESSETKPHQDLERSKQQREFDAQRRKELQESEKKNNERPLKVVSPQEKKEIRIRQNDGEYEVRLRDQKGNEQKVEDSTKSSRLRVELKATSREDLTEEELEEIGSRNAQQRLEERRERISEKIELRQSEDGEQRLELKSRDIAAKVSQSVELSINPETNELSVIGSDGEVIRVIHLPDQAISRMEELGSLSPANDNAVKQLELVTSENGKVHYKLTTNKKKKFLGLINRDVETEITLDDETGLTTEQEVVKVGILGLLNRLSF